MFSSNTTGSSREHKEGRYVELCVGVCVCEALGMCFPADNASIHAATQFSPCPASTYPREIYNIFVHVEINLVLQ